MTNQKAIIAEAIDTLSAHNLVGVLVDAGVSAVRIGKRGSGGEACHIDGYGLITSHDPGWAVRHYCTDGGDYSVCDGELAHDLGEVVAWTKKIS